MALVVNEEFDGVGLVFVFSGVLTADEAIRESQRRYTPEGLAKLRYQIADLSEVHRIEVTLPEIQTLAEIDRNAAIAAGGFLIASVVSHDLQQSVSNFYRTYVFQGALEFPLF